MRDPRKDISNGLRDLPSSCIASHMYTVCVYESFMNAYNLEPKNKLLSCFLSMPSRPRQHSNGDIEDLPLFAMSKQGHEQGKRSRTPTLSNTLEIRLDGTVKLCRQGSVVSCSHQDMPECLSCSFDPSAQHTPMHEPADLVTHKGHGKQNVHYSVLAPK